MATTLYTQNDDGDVANANSYISLAYFQSYHTQRGNAYVAYSDDQVKASIIRATDYLDTRFDFRGVKLNTGNKALGTLTATLNFSAAESVTIDEITWTFRASPSVLHDVQLGGSLAASLSSLAVAINDESNVVTATATATTLAVLAVIGGADGNDIVTTETAASASWGDVTLVDGDDNQSTEWPRKAGSDANIGFTTTLDTSGGFLDPVSLVLSEESTVFLVDPSGHEITGIPNALKRACAEYAFRALTIPLFQDAPAPEGGRLLNSEAVRVDVISSHKIYAPGQSGAFALPAFPAADMLLVRAGLILSGRTIMR